MLDFKVDNSWTLFLDRDGVINNRNFDGYIEKITDFHFLPFVIEGLKSLSEKFSRIFIVTNQQGVGKGFMTKDQLAEVHQFMLEEFQSNGIKIDAIFAATNLIGSDKDRRKPNPAMALEAKNKFPEIEFKKSIMVGDTDTDLRFGINLGMKTVLVQSKEKTSIQPDLVVNNLKELADEF